MAGRISLWRLYGDRVGEGDLAVEHFRGFSGHAQIPVIVQGAVVNGLPIIDPWSSFLGGA